MKKKLIIFDCYGTLLHGPKSNPHTKFLANIGLEPKALREKLMTEKSVDWSTIRPITMLQKDFDKHKKDLDLELKIEMNNIFPILDDLPEKLTKLREKYTVVILSNLSEEYAEPIEQYLAPYVDKCFYSFEIGKVKPRLEAFQHVIDWYEQEIGEIHPMEVMLVDDHSQNINKIKFIGSQGILVNNAHIESPCSIKAFFSWIDEQK
jgi:FMN phosphatase YigB (HAD superfamily)